MVKFNQFLNYGRRGMFGGCGCEGGGGDVRCWRGFGLRYSVRFRGVGYWVVGERK